MLEPVEALVALLALLGLVVALGRSSTARYEAERHRRRSAQDRAQADAAGTAAHPAGTRAAGRAGWWLVDEPGGPVLGGPFPDRVDADWAALSDGVPASAHVVYGTREADGTLRPRQSPQERAWLAELSGQLDRLPGDWDELLSDDDALTTLVVEVAAALVEAGFTLHDGVGDDPAGGVCLFPDPGRRGVLVSWRQHDRMSVTRVRGAAAEATVQRTMDAAVAAVLTDLGFPVTEVGDTGCHLVAVRRQSASAS